MTNRELIDKLYSEVFNRGDLTNIDTYMRDDYQAAQRRSQRRESRFISSFTAAFWL